MKRVASPESVHINLMGLVSVYTVCTGLLFMVILFSESFLKRIYDPLRRPRFA